MANDLHRYPSPRLTVDVVLLTLLPTGLGALLLRRGSEPFAGRAVLPGGFVRIDETLDAAAARVLADKAGLHDVFVEQLYTFGRPDRDPRARVVSVAYYALVPAERAPDAAGWHRVVHERRRGALHLDVLDADGAPLELGFDHAEILATAVQRLQGKIDYAPIGFELLPREFTLLQLQQVHEAVLGHALNKDSFRRRLLASGQLQATGRRRQDVGHRPPELFRFRNPR